MSGPQSPQDPPNFLAETRVMSGPQSPQDPGGNAFDAMAKREAGATAVATAPAQAAATAQTVSLRVKISKPEALAVAISSPDPMKIQIQKIEIEILEGRRVAKTVLISNASGQTISDATEPQVFKLSPSELRDIKPVLVEGNTALVKVEYLAETYGELHVSVIGHTEKHSAKEIIEHLFHH